jgi:DNA gyrase subunit A
MTIIPGPDFPTAGIINGLRGVREAYRTGRGKVYIRARTEIEDMDSGRQRIVVNELPYQVNKARLLEKIAELVKDKKLEGISELRDESDKDGMRMVIELRRGEVAEVVLNNLFQQTQMQNVFGINIVALVDGQPRTLNLKQLLEYFLRHRREVVTRRTLFDLRKARERAHLLEGLAVALANIDEVIALIKAAPSPAEAKRQLVERIWQSGTVEAMLARAGADASRPEGLDAGFGLTPEGYRLTETQAQAILDLRLQKLTGLEQDKIINEFEEILSKIADLLEILSSPGPPDAGDSRRTVSIKEQFGDSGAARSSSSDGPHSRRPDHRGRCRGDPVTPGLCEIPADRCVPAHSARWARQDGDRDQGRGFRRQAVRRQHARHHPVLLQSR